jgi:uncharacterized cupin superfamily protein
MVLEGTATVRTPDGTEQVGPLQVMFFPKGAKGAHSIGNDAEAPLRLLMWSTVKTPAITVYPDSDKIGVWTGGDRSDDIMVQRSAGVGYYRGEVEGAE